LEFFTKAWIEATISLVRTKGNNEGCGLEGILTCGNAMKVFGSLVHEKAFPQNMIRSLKQEWPSSPWSFVEDLISKAYSFPKRLGNQERWPGKSQVKQEVDEQALRGKGEALGGYPRKVLLRRLASSDSEDDYGRSGWKGATCTVERRSVT